MMCRLMGTATHLVHLEQRPIISGDFIIPDFMARFAPSDLLRGLPPEPCRSTST
jgi:hypothetical protein